MSEDCTQTTNATMRMIEQITAIKLMAISVHNPVFLEKGTLRLQTTGMGRAQRMTSSKTLHALLKVSKTSMSIHCGFWSGLPRSQ